MSEEIINLNQCGDGIAINIQNDCDDTHITINGTCSDNVNIEQSGSSVISVNGRYGIVTLTKDDVGLSNVDNVSVYGNFVPLSANINANVSGYLPLSGGTMTGVLSTTSTININDFTISGENLNSGIREIIPIDNFIKVFYQDSVKYFKMYNVDLYKFLVDEYGTQIVTENDLYFVV
jgi:hypothetical protein